jgi:hypothetical protein
MAQRKRLQWMNYCQMHLFCKDGLFWQNNQIKYGLEVRQLNAIEGFAVKGNNV